jgi:soluble lytic murein transglycosylase-like protein
VRRLHRIVVACAVAALAACGLGAARTLTAAGPAVDAVRIAHAPDPGRAALAAYLAERYGRDTDATRAYVNQAHAAAETFDLDPLLVLAVMAVESRFDPGARSEYGAHGLMQVVPRFHREKLADHGGEAALADPRVNALVGAQILKEYLGRSAGVRAGLQRYAGWQDDDEQRYARKVLAERHRLQRVVALALRDPGEQAS